MSTRKTKTTLAAVAVATALFITGCTADSSSNTQASVGSPQPGGTMIVGQYQEPTVLDPNRQYSWETWRIDRNIYETLVTEDLSSPSGVPEIVPALATDWTVSEDATTFTFNLREGVEFTDGTPFNAEAVEFNVRRFTDPDFEYYDAVSAGNMAFVYSDFESISVIDEYTVEYKFKSPFLEFLRLIPNSGNAPSAMFSPQALMDYGQDGLADNPVGTGPFEFVERVRGDHITLKRNENYWGEPAYLDEVIFRPIQSDPSRLAALEAGEVDLISRVSPDSVETLETEGFDVPEGTGANIVYYQFNFENEFMQNKAVREAIIMAIDREGLAAEIYNGNVTPVTSMFPPGTEAYDEATVDFEYDPEAAEALLSEAGYEPGDISFNLITDVANQPTAEWVQQNLAAVGIEITVESFDWLTYGTRSQNLTANDALRLGEWGMPSPQWLNVAYQYSVNGVPGGPEATSPETVAAVAAAMSNTDEAQKIDLWKQAGSTLAADATIIPILSFNRYYAISPNVGGFVWPAQNHYDLSKVWLKEQ